MSKITTAKVVAYLIAFVAAVSSYGHQVYLLELADLDPLFGVIPSAWITPATVDSLAIIALMVRTSDAVTTTRRRWALVPLVLAGGMSVAANVGTAHNLVQVVVGVWTVAAYIIAELFVGKMQAKPTSHPVPHNAPTSPGYPPLIVEAPEALAYRDAAAELRRTSRLGALNAG